MLQARSRTNLLTRLVFMVAMVLFYGCAGQVNFLSTLSEETVIELDQGVVVARIINASAYPLPFNQLTITPENLNESAEIKLERLLAVYPAQGSSTVFSSPVKAGTYALNSIRAYYTVGDGWYSRFVMSDAKFGTFTVIPGKVTDLGTVVFYPKVSEDKYIDTLVRLPEPQMGEVFEKYFPFYSYNVDQIGGWIDDDREEERYSFFASMVQNPVTFTERYTAPDKTLYFLGKLGAIIIRSPEGEWSLDAVDTNLNLNTIAKNSKGDLVAGGDEGKLFWKLVDHKWVDISLDNTFKIDKLIFQSDNSIDMLAREKTKLYIFRGRIEHNKPVWKTIDSYTSLNGWQSAPKEKTAKISVDPSVPAPAPNRISAVNLSTINGVNYLSIQTKSPSSDTLFSKSDNIKFTHTENWEMSPVDVDPEMHAVLDAGAIKLGVKRAGFWSWTGKPKYFRYDKSTKNWEKISTSVQRCRGGTMPSDGECTESGEALTAKQFSFRSIPWFKTQLEAVAIVSFSDVNLWASKKSYETKILITDDGGKTWKGTEGELPKNYCAYTIPEISDRLMIYCEGATGDFYESRDKGATWKQVRYHESF